ncbi:hypothetical protein [Methanospirillum lacunae]|uniref:Uncharacterized protein n=1 Tax=Methanospirillum lacunae TaxID=668570 RepID=A0A2V2N7F5_9EURY|nr:hypothetical protein [Methanospirillum lacunae]PWR74455.1 hypothetical protein DK846_04735 [Methanospirillum lacunae]
MIDDTSFWTFIGAISTFVYSILTIGLIIVTWWYAHAIRVKDQLSDLHEEMEKIVAPIYNNKENIWFFRHGHPNHMTNPKINYDYDEFWKNIKNNRNHTNNQIRQSINNFLELISSEPYRRIDEPKEFSEMKKQLINNIEIRYEELIDAIDSMKSPILGKIKKK